MLILLFPFEVIGAMRNSVLIVSQSGSLASIVMRNYVVMNVPTIQMSCFAKVGDVVESIARTGNVRRNIGMKWNVSRDVWGLVISEKAVVMNIVPIIE